jgi:hypothetical protein
MLRAVLTALAFALLVAPASAQEPPRHADDPDVRATANVIINALPETQYRDWGYRWDATSIRISRFVHWHIYEPERRDRPTDATVRRNGWIDGARWDVGISIYGGDETVTLLTFEYDFFALDLLEALRREGAIVSFQADYESYSEYIVTPPGREPGLLTTRRNCSPERSARAPHCQDSADLTFTLE